MPHAVQITFQYATATGALKVRTHSVPMPDGGESHALMAAVAKHGYYYVAPGDPPDAHTHVPVCRLIEMKEIIT